ncbi:unnamed protein product [Effrenium voratum]|nr:unnamed protein product [Effrenium voratum]
MLHAGARTTTWDRPPLSEGLARTATLLESARATPLASQGNLVTERADSSGIPGLVPRPPAQVPPTRLRALHPLVAGQMGAAGPVPAAPVPVPAYKPVLRSMGTWSEAPEAMATPWPGKDRPPLERLGTWSQAPQAAVEGWRPVAYQVVMPMRTASIPLQRADSSAVPAGQNAPVQRAPAPALQRAATVTVAELAVQAAQAPAPAPPRLLRAGTTLEGAPGALLVRSGTVTLPGGLQVLRPAPVTPLPSAAPTSTAVPAKAATPAQVKSKQPQRPLAIQESSSFLLASGAWSHAQEHAEVGRLLLQSVLVPREEKPLRQLRLVVGGLMGSGKSTICRMLRDLLEGTWINQDEFSHLGKAAKKAFLAAISKAAGDESVPVLLVDKINTMKQHREEIVDAMCKGRAGDVVFIQIKHPADGFNRWDQTLRLCEKRIAQRGEGHRTLKANNAQLRVILQRTAKGVEPMDQQEMSHFKGILTVDMTQNSLPQVSRLISDLDELDVLGSDVEPLLREERLLQALQAAQKLERELAAASGPPDDKEKKQKKPRPLWYWAVKLAADSSEQLMAWGGRAEECSQATDSGIQMAKEHHVTLLYMGGGKDEEIATRNPSLNGPQHVAWLREELQRRQGESVELEVSGIVWEAGRVASCAVTLRHGVQQLCANVYPHITLGTAPRVNAVVSNELLARRAAMQDLQSNLQAWLQQQGLGQYGPQLAAWCRDMGAASLEELAEFAAEAAAAVADSESQEHVAEALRKATQRTFCELTLEPPLQLTGVVKGMLKGRGQYIDLSMLDMAGDFPTPSSTSFRQREKEEEEETRKTSHALVPGTEAEHSQGNSTDARRWIREEEKERREAEKEEAALKAKLQAEHERLKKERQADEAELRAEVRREAQEARKEKEEKEAQEKKKHEAHKAAAEVFLAAASGKGDTESDESHKSGKSDKAAGSRPSQDDASGVHPSERIREEKERERERREREREEADLQAELEEEHERLVKERQAEKAALQAELAREDKEAQEQAKAQKSESPKSLTSRTSRASLTRLQDPVLLRTTQAVSTPASASGRRRSASGRGASASARRLTCRPSWRKSTSGW